MKLVDGDVLFVRTNGNKEYVGRSAVFSEAFCTDRDVHGPVIFASYLIRARPNISLVNPVWLQAELTMPRGRAALLERARTSAGQFNINIDGLSGIELVLPPLEDQRAFAARIREIDKLKAHHRAHLAKLDALFASLQDRAFRGELSGAALEKEIA